MVQKELFSAIYGRDLHATDTLEFLLQETEKHPYCFLSHYYLMGISSRVEEVSTSFSIKAPLFFDDMSLLYHQLQLINEAPVVIPVFNSLQASAKSLTETKEPNEDLPLFEPLHTTDYFASQGIKLSEQLQTGDKLGKQLKSFTEWLKTIKKTPDSKNIVPSSRMDMTVEQLAEKSNQETAVITEAMAEVLIQQGKKDKAVEVYEKLSLLNPDKSAYFAGKIKYLK